MSLEKELIKLGLEINKHGIYPKVVNHYIALIKSFGVIQARMGIAKDLGIAQEKINLASLRNAYQRQKGYQKLGNEKQKTIYIPKRVEIHDEQKAYEMPKHDDIIFS